MRLLEPVMWEQINRQAEVVLGILEQQGIYGERFAGFFAVWDTSIMAKIKIDQEWSWLIKEGRFNRWAWFRIILDFMTISLRKHEITFWFESTSAVLENKIRLLVETIAQQTGFAVELRRLP